MQIAPTDFYCTHDYPKTDTDSPEPIVFEVDDSGFLCRDDSHKTGQRAGLGANVLAARDKAEPPQNKVGFGV